MDKAAQVIWHKRIDFKNGVFEAYILVLKIPIRDKFPDGFKLKCVLANTELNIPVLLVDNHEPFGYHMHTRLPYDKKYRVTLNVNSYQDAISLFMSEAEKVVNNET